MHQNLQKQTNTLMERLITTSVATSQDSLVVKTADLQNQSYTPYEDPNETRRKYRKAFSTNFSSKVFAGKFGDD